MTMSARDIGFNYLSFIYGRISLVESLQAGSIFQKF